MQWDDNEKVQIIGGALRNATPLIHNNGYQR